MNDPVIADLNAHLNEIDDERNEQEFIDDYVDEHLDGRISSISTYSVLSDAVDDIEDGLDVAVASAIFEREHGSLYSFSILRGRVADMLIDSVINKKEQIARESLISEAKAKLEEAKERKSCRHCRNGKSCEC